MLPDRDDPAAAGAWQAGQSGDLFSARPWNAMSPSAIRFLAHEADEGSTPFKPHSPIYRVKSIRIYYVREPSGAEPHGGVYEVVPPATQDEGAGLLETLDKVRPNWHFRFPHLGPGAIGACVLGAYAVGWLFGPLAGLGGAVIGMMAGDLLDQSQERSTSNSNDT
jgi:hypothetical protein